MSRKPSIAIIDDDDSFRTALVDSLSSLGYDGCGFASAEDFVAGERKGSCDCIITDIHMPGMSGFDLQRLLASHHSRIPVIMITARTEPDLEARVTSSGALCLLHKPFETEVLLGCLARALGA